MQSTYFVPRDNDDFLRIIMSKIRLKRSSKIIIRVKSALHRICPGLQVILCLPISINGTNPVANRTYNIHNYSKLGCARIVIGFHL